MLVQAVWLQLLCKVHKYAMPQWNNLGNKHNKWQNGHSTRIATQQLHPAHSAASITVRFWGWNFEQWLQLHPCLRTSVTSRFLAAHAHFHCTSKIGPTMWSQTAMCASLRKFHKVANNRVFHNFQVSKFEHLLHSSSILKIFASCHCCVHS